MTVVVHEEVMITRLLDAAIQAVCGSIAPNWPLDRMIAVNPYWSWIDQPFHAVAHHLAQSAGSPLTMPLDYYRSRWATGAIRQAHLQQALIALKMTGRWDSQAAIQALHDDDPLPTPAPLLSDTLDSQRDLQRSPAWRETITRQVAQFCAAYFDQDQADWHPAREAGLYASWRDSLRHDHSVALLMNRPQLPALAAGMATTPRAQIRQALTQLAIDPAQWQATLQAVMYRVSGWGAWCAYQQWQAALVHQTQDNLVDLLAIRLSWELLLDDRSRAAGSNWQRWQQAWANHITQYQPAQTEARLIWQRAHEISYQQTLSALLTPAGASAPVSPGQAVATAVQAAFCIDVRSEVIRRHLEAQSAAITTLGCAGFFGLPVSYTPLGTDITRPQLPGLLAPEWSVTDSSGDPALDALLAAQQRAAYQRRAGWSLFNAMPASTFTLVETLGVGYLAKLIRRALPWAGRAAKGRQATSAIKRVRPMLSADPEARVALAAKALTGMGLTQDLAPLVLLVGHGSDNANNPQRAGLECGACCGQSGEVNVRALAHLLNDPAVRAGLVQHGMQIPATTRFVAAFHNTTTEALTLFDTDLCDAACQQALARLQVTLDAASSAARSERAPGVGLSAHDAAPQVLQQQLVRRARDWAQTRPEWGLANNAAFIIAPRSRTRGLMLGGRTFLHEYRSESDPDARWLAQIMTAPMIVAHWINMQYYASTVDNRRYGAGNKTLHNVVGGRLGVFEGNGGDLRIGLAMQSVHDGESWRHEPLRLTVVIDAPVAAIRSVLAAHPLVRQLVDNQWLYLARFDQGRLAFFEQGSWQVR